MTTRKKNVTLLAGGVGASKLVSGLVQVHDEARLRIISNTGDDVERHGLWISPDVDIMLYTLAGIVDPVRGWGIRGDTFETLAALEQLGEDTWFRLGDRDLATHILRTSLRARGWTATRIAAHLAERLNVRANILPMTDAAVFTEVLTRAGLMHFQEFFVKHECRPDIVDVAYRGAEDARPTAAVLQALDTADLVIICPSNPIASIGPILSLGGIRKALKKNKAPVIAVSPLIGGKSLKGPSDRMMRAKGFTPDSLGVANYYKGLIDGLVMDSTDWRMAGGIPSEWLAVCLTNTVMATPRARARLAASVMEFGLSLHDQRRRSRKEPVRC